MPVMHRAHRRAELAVGRLARPLLTQAPHSMLLIYRRLWRCRDDAESRTAPAEAAATCESRAALRPRQVHQALILRMPQ